MHVLSGTVTHTSRVSHTRGSCCLTSGASKPNPGQAAAASSIICPRSRNTPAGESLVCTGWCIMRHRHDAEHMLGGSAMEVACLLRRVCCMSQAVWLESRFAEAVWLRHSRNAGVSCMNPLCCVLYPVLAVAPAAGPLAWPCTSRHLRCFRTQGMHHAVRTCFMVCVGMHAGHAMLGMNVCHAWRSSVEVPALGCRAHHSPHQPSTCPPTSRQSTCT